MTDDSYRIRLVNLTPGDIRRAHSLLTLYQRTDELAVLLAGAITRHSWSSPLVFGCRRRGASAGRVHAAQHRRVFRVDGWIPRMTCTALAVQ
jgi:hypothetical protein